MADTVVPTIVDMAAERGVVPEEPPKTILAALRLLDEVVGDKKEEKGKEG